VRTSLTAQCEAALAGTGEVVSKPCRSPWSDQRPEEGGEKIKKKKEKELKNSKILKYY